MATPSDKNPALLAHQLILAMTFTGITGTCICDQEFGDIVPGQTLDIIGAKWARHTMEAIEKDLS